MTELHDLNIDVLTICFQHLDATDLLRFRTTCKYFHKLEFPDQLWFNFWPWPDQPTIETPISEQFMKNRNDEISLIKSLIHVAKDMMPLKILTTYLCNSERKQFLENFLIEFSLNQITNDEKYFRHLVSKKMFRKLKHEYSLTSHAQVTAMFLKTAILKEQWIMMLANERENKMEYEQLLYSYFILLSKLHVLSDEKVINRFINRLSLEIWSYFNLITLNNGKIEEEKRLDKTGLKMQFFMKPNQFFTYKGQKYNISMFLKSFCIYKSYKDFGKEGNSSPYQKIIAELQHEIDCIDRVQVLEVLLRTLTETHGITGNTGDYYNIANSFLDTVILKMKGNPLNLTVLLALIAGAIGLKGMNVRNFPQHVVASLDLRVKSSTNPTEIDSNPFKSSRILSEEVRKIEESTVIIDTFNGQISSYTGYTNGIPQFHEPMLRKEILKGHTSSYLLALRSLRNLHNSGKNQIEIMYPVSEQMMTIFSEMEKNYEMNLISEEDFNGMKMERNSMMGLLDYVRRHLGFI